MEREKPTLLGVGLYGEAASQINQRGKAGAILGLKPRSTGPLAARLKPSPFKAQLSREFFSKLIRPVQRPFVHHWYRLGG